MHESGRRWSTTPWWRLFGAIFVITFALIAIWSVAMPLLSGPDEPTHVVKAAGVIRGQFVGQCNDNASDPLGVCPKSSPFTEVRLPAFFSLLRNGGNIPGTKIPHHGVECFSKRITIPASCVIFASSSMYQHLVENAWIYDGRYPPLYYVVVGAPTLFGSGLWDLYLMRFFSAAASALLLSAAIFSILRYARSRILLLGLVVSATPMVFYLSGVVNSSGLEIASALAFWTTTTIMVRECEGPAPRSLVVTSALAALTFVSTRSLSPLWLVLTVVSVVAIARWQVVVALFSRRDVQLGIVAIAAIGLVDVFWIIYEHSTVLNVSSANAKALIPPPSTSELTILRTSFHHNIYYLPGMIGVFGAFDTYAPHFTFILWYLLGGALFIAALVTGDLRRRVVLVLVALGILVLPVIISSSQVRHIGYVWSGRDTLPFAVGLPVLCASVIGEHRQGKLLRWSVLIVLVLAWVAQADSFFGALRRYSVGDAGSHFSFLFHSSWSPPVLGCFGAFLVELVVLALAYFAVFVSFRFREPGNQLSGHPNTQVMGIARAPEDLVEAE